MTHGMIESEEVFNIGELFGKESFSLFDFGFLSTGHKTLHQNNAQNQIQAQ